MSDHSAIAARLSAHMAAHGLKSTQQRQVILDVFLEAEEHLALDELLLRVQERKSGVGYATIYRTMKLFVEAGVAQERRFGDGQTRFEIAELGDEHHDHLICETCGHIFEFEDDEIERRQASIAARHGLAIKRHRLDIWGECQAPGTCRFRAEQERLAAS